MRTIVIAGIVAAALTPPAVWLYYELSEEPPAPAHSSDSREQPRRPATDDSVARTAPQPAAPAPAASPAAPAAPAASDETQTAARDDGGAVGQGAAGTAVTALPKPDTAAASDSGTGDAGDAQPARAAPTPPSFDVVRIDRDGGAVIAGRAPAQSRVVLQREGAVIAEVQADANGEWVLVLSRPLPAGPTQLELVARLPDGRELAANDALAVVVPDRATVVAEAAPAAGVAKSETAGEAPAKPAPSDTALAVLLPKQAARDTKILQLPEPRRGDTREGLNLDKVDYDEQGNVVISGTATPGSAVRLYVDNKPVGVGQTDAAGDWTVRPDRPITEGDHRLRADQVGAAGAVTARIELPFTRVAARRLLDAPTTHRVIVQPGNSLWRIARRVYGAGIHFTVIYQANQTQIRDANLIYPGQVFDLPETE